MNSIGDQIRKLIYGDPYRDYVQLERGILLKDYPVQYEGEQTAEKKSHIFIPVEKHVRLVAFYS
jgi:hypothetical protein